MTQAMQSQDIQQLAHYTSSFESNALLQEYEYVFAYSTLRDIPQLKLSLIGLKSGEYGGKKRRT